MLGLSRLSLEMTRWSSLKIAHFCAVSDALMCFELLGRGEIKMTLGNVSIMVIKVNLKY